VSKFEKKLINISSKFIYLILGLSIILLVAVLYQYYVIINANYNDYYKSYSIFLIFFIFFWIAVLIFTKKAQPLILIFFISIMSALYFVEIVFLSNIWLQFNKSQNFPGYDKRSKLEVIQDLNDDNAITAISPKYIFFDDVKKKNIVPLSGVSNSKTIMCNERGEWIIYRSDRYGFNNPDAAWENKKNDIMILGDSFAYGSCVSQNENIAANLRKKDLKTLSLAYAGNGPLSMLGTLKEFHKVTNPRYIIWTYYEGNDLFDLKRELSYNSFDFKNYFKKNFSQNLSDKQEQVDTILRKLYQETLREKIDKKSKVHNDLIEANQFVNKIHKFDLTKAITLYNIRALLGVIYTDHEKYIYESFLKVIHEAKKFSEEKNSELIFVYLPRFNATMKYSNTHNKEKIINLMNDVGIRVIDIDKLVFKSHADPLTLFPFKRKNHYNKEGYSLVSDAIFNNLINK